MTTYEIDISTGKDIIFQETASFVTTENVAIHGASSLLILTGTTNWRRRN